MAKLSVIRRNENRKNIHSRDYEKRKMLKSIIKNKNTSWEERMSAVDKLNSMSRNGSSVRIVSRCRITGRARGVQTKWFGLCRHVIREQLLKGCLPGYGQACW